MEDGSYDPRTWVAADRDDHGDMPPADAFSPAGFALASPAALRLWLGSIAVLALAAASAWSMRPRTDAMVRIDLPPAVGESSPAG